MALSSTSMKAARFSASRSVQHTITFAMLFTACAGRRGALTRRG